MKKTICTLFLVAAVSETQARPSPENAILTLTCNVSYESRTGNEGYKPEGPRFQYTVTVYKENNNHYIKQQDGTYNPTWWGEGMTWSGLSRTVSNVANMNAETIWAHATTKSIDGVLNEHDLEINRSNGAIRGKSKYSKSQHRPDETNLLMKGLCIKSSKAF